MRPLRPERSALPSWANFREKMHPEGVEPSTFWFVVRHSIQLRYGCVIIKKRKTGFEPATPTMARWCSTTELLPQMFNLALRSYPLNSYIYYRITPEVSTLFQKFFAKICPVTFVAWLSVTQHYFYRNFGVDSSLQTEKPMVSHRLADMRIRGFEPPRHKGHKNLNLARLPVPPYPHK